MLCHVRFYENLSRCKSQLTFVMIEDMIFRVHYYLFSVNVPVKIFFCGFLQNTNLYNLTASLFIALSLPRRDIA